MSEKLSLLDNSSDSEVELTVNKNYANSYNQWRNKEELQKYKDLKKEEEDSESSSESEEEIPEFDEEFFRALSLLKGKDPRIFDKNFELFKEKEIVKKPKTVKPKPMYMKDYERNLVLEKGGKFSDEDEDVNPQERFPTYNEEQEELKKSFKEAVRSLDESDEDNDDDLLQVRSKTEKEEEAEEEDYVKWLKGEEKNVSDDIKQDMSYLRSYWNDPKLDEGEKFLRDYILNKKYLEKDDSEIPTYEELTSGMLSDDEKMIEEQEKFEHKYNFRFEEPDEEFIKRYPRTVGDSLRRPDTRRKQKREEMAERKRKDKEQRREELKRLKALKRKEIEEKFMKLKEISGQDEINLNESDMESDFDPDKHDQKMREMFNEEYYQVQEDQKPEFPFDEELDSENWNTWAGEKIIEEDEEENEKDLTAKEKNEGSSREKLNPREEFANEMINASLPKKRVKKKSLFAKIISQPKPVYDPDGKSFEEYLDEYYKLDFEDVVGDLPVRYKYRKVIPNDFGLTVDEILKADDKELNRWCSVKKTCQYRKDEEELYDVQAFQKKAQNPVVKKKFLPSVYAPEQIEEPSAESTNLSQEEVNHTELQDSDNAVQIEKMDVQSNFNYTMEKEQKEGLDSSVQSRKSKKKRKRKNRQENQNTSGNDKPIESSQFTEDQETSSMDIDNKSYVTNGVKRNRSSKPEECSNDQPVKKKKLIEYSFAVNSDSEVNGTDNNVPKKLKNEPVTHSQLNASEATTKKKKKCRENKISHNNSSLSESSDRQLVNKKKISDSLSVDSDPEANDTDNMPEKFINERESQSQSNVSENAPEVSAKKKKKKKKKKKNKPRDNETSNNNAPQGDKSKEHHSKFKNKYQQHVTEDKRLGLSDARLAAYGINPKKFKNKIIYSKK